MALRTPLSVTPHLYMGDSTGRPLDMGTVYFGEQDKDPEFYPINLFSDDALTLPLMQPVHTKGGYLYDKGDMVEPHAKELIYSVKVLDSYGRKVFYKGAMMRNSWNDDVIQQINEAILASGDVARQVATDITNEAINNTAIEGGVLADTFVTATPKGVGAVARTQRDINSEKVSVKDFGAVGDGITDDTVAINKAVNNGSGADIYVPDGIYLITEAIVLPPNTTITCANDAWLKGDGVNRSWGMVKLNDGCYVSLNVDGALYDHEGNHGITALNGVTLGKEIHDVTVVNCQVKNVMTGIRFHGGNNCYVSKNRISRTRNTGILVHSAVGLQTVGNTFSDNYFEDMGDVAIAFYAMGSEGRTEFNLICNNHILNTQRITQGYAIDFEGTLESKGHNAIVNNLVEQVEVHPFGQGGIIMRAGQKGIIAGNVLRGNAAAGASGLSVTASKDTLVYGNTLDNFYSGINVVDGYNCTVSSNHLLDCGRTNRVFPAINMGGLGASIINNNISFTEGNDFGLTHGIGASLDAPNNLARKDTIIRGNKIHGFAGAGIYISGVLSTYIENTIISDNNLAGLKVSSNSNVGMNLNYTKSTAVTGNTLRDLYMGMQTHYTDDMLITNNIIEDVRATPAMYSYIGLSSGEGAPTSMIIKDNVFKGVENNNAMTPISTSNLPTIKYIDNIGYMTDNSGSVADVASGAVINHGLRRTPTQVFLTKSSMEELTNIYVSNITATTFTVNFTGEATGSFYWQAKA